MKRNSPLPFRSFILSGKKYNVLSWGDTKRGQKHIVVKLVMTCTNRPWPSIQIGSKESGSFQMAYPIKCHGEILIMKSNKWSNTVLD